MLYSSRVLELQYPSSSSLLLWTECSCPLEILRLKSKPPGDSTWRWEVIRSWGWCPHDGINGLGRKGRRATSLCHMRTHGRQSPAMQEGDSLLNQIGSTWILNFSLQTVVLCCCLQAYGILFWLLQQTRLPSHWRIKSLSVSLECTINQPCFWKMMLPTFCFARLPHPPKVNEMLLASVTPSMLLRRELLI